MKVLEINSSFGIRAGDLEEIKKNKLLILQNNTENFILSKYPYYKQINDYNSKIKMNIEKIKYKYNKIKSEIEQCDNIEKLLDIYVDMDNISILMENI